MLVLAARPSVGKTTFALNLALHATAKLKKKVLFFSLERSKEKLARRLVSMMAKVNNHQIRLGRLDSIEKGRLSAAWKTVGDLDLLIADTPGMSVSELVIEAKYQSADESLDLVIVDNLQMLSSPGVKGGRAVEVADCSRRIKILAGVLEVPILVLSQLTLEVDREGEPRVSHFGDSDPIAQDADVVILLHGSGERGKGEDTEVVQLHVVKNRNGRQGVVKLQLHRFHQLLTPHLGEDLSGSRSDAEEILRD